MDKKEIRAEIRRRKGLCPQEQRAELSRAAIERLQQTAQWQQAHTVLLYHSLPDEVCTHDLIPEAIRQGKRVLLPVVVGDELELREYQEGSQLAEGAFHIQEPTGTAVTDFATIDLAVIPGVAFTAGGLRLGRGRGYYDRLLSRARVPYLIGLCWPFQLLPDLPAEPHDVKMDEVIC
ncbi:MAG: 5-formyltetrahydrofolate cyclo-ligase [Bacteroidaceae bacterium]|nr:5-formyltetrahydrofolate cyclo-ligase [Bacteroidaceae bacterium]